MAKREDRKSAIRSLVRAEEIRTQKELVDRLQALGFDCTQATVSRDIAEMGFVKSDGGFYALAEDLALKRLVGELALFVDAAQNIVVVKTRPGSASMLGEVALVPYDSPIDNADIEGIVGTIAGDNTIMIVAKTEQRAREISERLQQMLR